jgi:hypothetical protein
VRSTCGMGALARPSRRRASDPTYIPAEATGRGQSGDARPRGPEGTCHDAGCRSQNAETQAIFPMPGFRVDRTAERGSAPDAGGVPTGRRVPTKISALITRHGNFPPWAGGLAPSKRRRAAASPRAPRGTRSSLGGSVSPENRFTRPPLLPGQPPVRPSGRSAPPRRERVRLWHDPC